MANPLTDQLSTLLTEATADVRHSTRNLAAQREALITDVRSGAETAALLTRVGRISEDEAALLAAETLLTALRGLA